MTERGEGSYIGVRLGKVLGSHGSVVHGFTAQIAAGDQSRSPPGHPRYFSTGEEADQLIIRAGPIGTAGEVMILDPGQPVKNDDVAQQVIDLSGKDFEIVYRGLRDGEEHHERLLGAQRASAPSTRWWPTPGVAAVKGHRPLA